jgi:hypothetical protein
MSAIAARASIVLSLALGLAVACGGTHATEVRPASVVSDVKPGPLAAPILPDPSGELLPSQVRVAIKGDADMTDSSTCADCHMDVAAQWKTSVHALASFDNPVYRVAVESFRKRAGNDKSRFCAGCHDISLLVTGGMADEIRPDDVRAHSGIGCRTCHGISHTRPDGNSSYDLDTSAIPIPKNTKDVEGIRLHKQRVMPQPLKGASTCMSCHRVFLDTTTGNAHHLPGQDEATPWMRSAFAGSTGERIDDEVEAKDCRGCHMPKEDAPLGDVAAKNGKIASHRFLGAHTYMAAMRGDPAQLAAVQARLKKAATIDVAAMGRTNGSKVILPEGASLDPGERVTFDVVIRSVAVGHRFPGGTLDSQDTWVDLVVTGKDGHIVAEAGTEQEKTGVDPTAHVLKAVLLDQGGKPVLHREVDQFRTVVTNHTIAPRDAAVVRFGFEVPAALPAGAFPLTVRARLMHRSRNLELQEIACKDTKTPRGQAFAKMTKAMFDVALDACAPQPITELARSEIEVGPGASKERSGDPSARAYALGLGWTHALQEDIEQARAPLLFARETAKTPAQRARAEDVLAQLAARQGRVAETLAWTDRAAEVFPGHPSLARSRGEAWATTWQFDRASPELQKAALAAPRDDGIWSRLAVSLGSANMQREAFDASRAGLLMQPRDPDCLRVQALALERLGAPEDVVRVAKDAYFERRTPDDAPGIKAKCSAKVPGCAMERVPVHVHETRPVGAPLPHAGQ